MAASCKRRYVRARMLWRDVPLALKVGLILTPIWLGAVLGYSQSFEKVKSQNELGDFLAGVFAPLAFLWLVIAVFLQKDELGYQRQELIDSRIAQQRLALETVELVKVSKSSLAHQLWKAEDLELQKDVELLCDLLCSYSPRIIYSYAHVKRPLFGHLEKENGLDTNFADALGSLISWFNARDRVVLDSNPAKAAQLADRIQRQLMFILDNVPLEKSRPGLAVRIEIWQLSELFHMLGEFQAWLKTRVSK